MRRSLAVPFLFLAACGSGDGPGDPPAGPPAARPKLTGARPLNDLSILFPLPERWEDRDLLLGPESQGAKGPLLPRAIYDRAPKLHTLAENDQTWERLRVVAARVDPCFPGLVSDEAECRPQLRFVLQPLWESEPDVAHAQDAALHLFYELTRAELFAVLQGLADLGAVAPECTAEAPLGVHPALAAQGLDGAYARGLKSLLLAHAGAASLEQMTFMAVEGLNNSVWRFGGFDLRGSAAQVLPIEGVAEDTQRFFNIFVFTEEDFVGSVEPAVSPPDDLSPLYNSNLARDLPEARIRQVLGAAHRIESPARHTPESIDCVSCHLATGVRAWIERNYPELESEAHPDRFRSSKNLALESEVLTNTSALRAFGWLGADVAMSQRVVNETAAILEAIEEAQASD